MTAQTTFCYTQSTSAILSIPDKHVPQDKEAFWWTLIIASLQMQL